MKNLITFLLIVVATLSVTAQEKVVCGIITDENGIPLPAATILVKDTVNGTSSDFDGNYTITAQLRDVLVFSYVGYRTEEISVGSESKIDVSLQLDSNLDEVVVTALGIKRKREDITYVGIKVDSESLNKEVNSSTVQALSDKVSGLQIKRSNSYVPSTNITLRGNNSLKGNNQALIVIDGIRASEKELKNLSLKDIKSTNVVKGASGSALYGSEGANGVIIITTNKGTEISEELLRFKTMNIKKQQLFNNETYTKIHENKFETVLNDQLSTFSIDVDKAGYSNVRRLINNGQFIPSDAIKIEEMVNYFNYNYPQPKDKHPFSINTEVVKTPWHKDTQLVRIGLQGKSYENKDLPAANLTFLLDVSGSMRGNLELLKEAFKLLVHQLREKDKVSIVVYAVAAGVVLEPTSGKHKDKIISALNNLQAGGSTAGGQGIELAYKLAQENFNKKGNNRVILATDGDFNVGASSDSVMEELIVKKRESGVFLSVLGFGYGNYKDSKLETLADKGNGNHAYIDTMQEAKRVFGQEFGGTLFTIAKDVKIQVEFNPNHVQAYRLIGYENRLLANEDFIDDTKDAGELGPGHTVTALYEIIPVGVSSSYLKSSHELKYTKPLIQNYKDELFTVKFRYKKPDQNKSTEMIHIQNFTISKASNDMNFASAVALFGMKLRQSQFYNNASLKDIVALAVKGRGQDKKGYRAEFIRLVESCTDFE
jgi:Ca-activated chloride channel family protein